MFELVAIPQISTPLFLSCPKPSTWNKNNRPKTQNYLHRSASSYPISMAATAAASATSGLNSRTLLDSKAAAYRGQCAPHCIRLLSLPRKITFCSRTGSRGRIVMATGETPAEVSTELLEIVTPVKEAWDKLEDKYAVATLVFVGLIGLWVATGMISAIDRLPIVPGVFELVGIGYTGWFVYSNLVFKPDREVLVEKIKRTYSEIVGTAAVNEVEEHSNCMEAQEADT